MPSYLRKQNIAPWYWAVYPRCTTLVLYGDRHQCFNSARWQDKAHSDTQCCKVHRDMLIIEGHKFLEIEPVTVDIRDLES